MNIDLSIAIEFDIDRFHCLHDVDRFFDGFVAGTRDAQLIRAPDDAFEHSGRTDASLPFAIDIEHGIVGRDIDAVFDFFEDWARHFESAFGCAVCQRERESLIFVIGHGDIDEIVAGLEIIEYRICAFLLWQIGIVGICVFGINFDDGLSRIGHDRELNGSRGWEVGNGFWELDDACDE